MGAIADYKLALADYKLPLYPSIALCECVNSVSKQLLGAYIGTCTQEEMAHVDAALCVSLGIEPQTVTIKPKESEQEKKEKALGKLLVELFRGVKEISGGVE